MPLQKNEVRELREKLQPLLAKLEGELGFKLSLGNAIFDGEIVTFKLECSRIRKDGSVPTKAAQEFNSLCTLFGLVPEDLGRTFAYQGRTFTISGLNSRAKKMPIVAKGSDGKLYKFGRGIVSCFLPIVSTK